MQTIAPFPLKNPLKRRRRKENKNPHKTENADRDVKHNEARDNSNFHTRETFC